MSMFSFQAIHNFVVRFAVEVVVVYRLCQCSLFKQFTTNDRPQRQGLWLFIDYVNVLFQAIHNMCREYIPLPLVVYRLCQCSLFKQFTTADTHCGMYGELFIDYVNVLFSSNSQRFVWQCVPGRCCLSIMSMFSFQAIHNRCRHFLLHHVLFIDYVNVLFSSNSQPRTATLRPVSGCLSIMSMFSFQAIGRVRNRLNNLSPVGRGLGVTMVNLSSLLFSILQRRRGILSPALLVVFTTE